MSTAHARSIPEKIGDWKAAFDAVSAELTPQPMRKFLGAFSDSDDVAKLRSYQELAKLVAANDRAAALVAAMLTSAGVKPVPVSIGIEDE